MTNTATVTEVIAKASRVIAAATATLAKVAPLLSVDRDEAIAGIRRALRRRSGKAWSVTGGRGTAWGWITITAPPARRMDGYYMSPEDQKELAALLNLDAAHFQGVTIPASSAHRREFLQRARGETVTEIAQAYWD